jgi:hypothetical protein
MAFRYRIDLREVKPLGRGALRTLILWSVMWLVIVVRVMAG